MFLNPKSGMAVFNTEVTVEARKGNGWRSGSQGWASVYCGVTISDCNRQITLDMNCTGGKADGLVKINKLIALLEETRDEIESGLITARAFAQQTPTPQEGINVGIALS